MILKYFVQMGCICPIILPSPPIHSSDDGLVFYIPFNIICHIETMKGDALCNEVPYSHELNWPPAEPGTF